MTIGINLLLLLISKDNTLLLLIHDVLDGTSILMKINRCLILICQFLTHIIFLGCLVIQTIKMLLRKLIVELTFQQRSQTQSLLILQFLLIITCSIMRRILLAVDYASILIIGFQIVLTIVTSIYLTINNRRERRWSLAFHHSHHLSLQHLRNTLVVHQVHILLGKLSIKSLGIFANHGILPDTYLLEGITKTIIAESLQLGNILICEVKLLIKLPRILESGIFAHKTRETNRQKISTALQESFNSLLTCRLEVRILRHTLKNLLTSHNTGIRNLTTNISQNIGSQTSALAYHISDGSTLHDGTYGTLFSHLAQSISDNLTHRRIVNLAILIKLASTINLINRLRDCRLTTKGNSTMHGSALQSRSLTLADKHLGSSLCHLALHTFSHQVTSQFALSLSHHALRQLASSGSWQPITPGITCKSQRTTSHILPEARLILLIGNILQPVLVVRLHNLARYLADDSVLDTSLQDVVCTTSRNHTLNLQLVEFILDGSVNHRLELLRITTQSAIQAIPLHHLKCGIAHVIQEIRIPVELAKLLLQTAQNLLRVTSLISLSHSPDSKRRSSIHILRLLIILRHLSIRSRLCVLNSLGYRCAGIFGDNVRKSLVNILVHQSVLYILIVSIETSSDTLGYIAIVRTIFVHQTLYHGRFQEMSHIVIITDTHAVCLLLQLILHAMAIPLRPDTLLSILHRIIRQRRYYLVGNVHGRTVGISVQSRHHHIHCLLIAIGSTISQQVGNHIRKVIALLIRSLLPVLNIVGKFGIH